LAQKNRAILIKTDPEIPIENDELPQIMSQADFVPFETGKSFESIQPRFAMTISIAADNDALLQSFHHKTRYNIRLAGRRGVEVSAGAKEDLPEFYSLLQETAERDRF